jgi:NNP family nitrate/nitrite transporter-like MFS transporter
MLAVGFTNTNALIMLVTYGLCFGVELCMNNKLPPYMTRYYGFNPKIAGPISACFGLMNIFARSWGGILSDWCNKKYGMRGRITAMWIVQTIEGVFCILMGLVTVNAVSPDDKIRDGFGAVRIPGVYEAGGVSYVLNGSDFQIGLCASDLVAAPPTALVDGVVTEMPVAVDSLIMIRDPDRECIHHASSLGLTMFLMICFSICVQMAEGLHYGIVPYISRPALGVCSGMVGAGGNLGALMGSKYWVGARHLDEGFVNLGIIICSVSVIMHFIFFPGEGGILLPKTLKYNPQLLSCGSTGMKGSDETVFDGVKDEPVISKA